MLDKSLIFSKQRVKIFLQRGKTLKFGGNLNTSIITQIVVISQDFTVTQMLLFCSDQILLLKLLLF